MTLSFPRAHAQCRNVVAACCGTLSVVCSTCGHRPSNTHPDNFSMWNMWLLWRSFSNICPQMHIRLRLSYSKKDQTQYFHLCETFFFFIFKETHSMNEMGHGWFIYRIPFPFSLCLCSWIASIWFRPRPLQPCIVRWWPAVAGWHHLSPSLFRPNFLMPLCWCHDEHSWAFKLS